MKIALTNHPCCAGTESLAACSLGIPLVFYEAVGFGGSTYAVSSLPEDSQQMKQIKQMVQTSARLLFLNLLNLLHLL